MTGKPSRLRVGVIGIGGIAWNIHLPALNDIENHILCSLLNHMRILRLLRCHHRKFHHLSYLLFHLHIHVSHQVLRGMKNHKPYNSANHMHSLQ